MTGISLDKTSVTLNTTDTYTLIANVDPIDASNKSVIWSSSDAAIATVDENGVVIGMKAGTATITATTVDGNFTATCQVIVKPILVVSVKITCEEDQLLLTPNQQTLHFSASVLPENATDKDLVWSIESGDDLATITQNGVLQAIDGVKKDGEVVVRATAVDQSNAYDEVTVSLQGFATGIQSFDQQVIFISSPVADRLYIRGDFDRLKHISIIDSSGRIYVQVEQLISGESIDVSPLSRGIYYMVMEKNMNWILQKFIKMK